ncbi:hypothetical protein SLA2020_166090 [Shorea laevis]
MAWRLRSSLIHLFTGKRSYIPARKMIFSPFRCHVGMRNSVAMYSSRSLSYMKALGSFQYKGFESLKQPLHTSTDNDDDFEELGDPVENGLPMPIKLKTKKPEPYRWKVNAIQKPSCGTSLKEWGSSSLKGTPPEAGNGFRASGLRLDNEKKASNSRISHCVTIENVPSIIKPFQLKEAVSVFGKVSIVSMRSVENGLDCCDVEFESSESSKKAIETGSVTIDGFNLAIHPVHVFQTIAIRISNIRSGTTDSTIHSVCTSCGPLEGLTRVEQDTVDVFFKVRTKSEIQRILNRLDTTFMDTFRWSAKFQPINPTSVTMTDKDDGNDALCDLELIDRRLDELRREIIWKKIYAEDLKCLHDSLVHLKNLPQML